MAAKTGRVGKEKYANYIKKSEEFHRSAHEAANRGDWTAVLSNAVHSAISTADALTVFYAGERLTALGLSESIRVLSVLGITREELDLNMKHLTALLEVKNTGEYEDRLPSQSEADLALQNSEQFRRWALSKLPGRASS